MASLNFTLSAPAPDESPYKTIIIPTLDPTVYADGFKVYGSSIFGSPRSDAWRLVSGVITLTTGVAVADRYINVGYFLNNPKYGTGYQVGGVKTEAIAASGSGALGIGSMGSFVGSGAWAVVDPKNGFFSIGDLLILEYRDYFASWVTNLNDDFLEAVLKFEYLNRRF